MERVTEWRGEHAAVVNHHENYIDKLAAYEDAEEQGRLLILPCKVGDVVYYVDGGKSYKAKASAFRFNESGVRVYCERNFMGRIGFEGIFGRTVFLTREEAEAALKEVKNDV